jgi:hypothetical protein
MNLQISIAVIGAILAIVAEHYFPWRLIYGRELPRVPAYILGVLAFALPLSVLFWIWSDYRCLAALWAVIGAAGAGTALCYTLDTFLHNRARALEAEERERDLRKTLNG